MPDMLGRAVNAPEFPRRIISLVPSQTELLHDLGLEAEVVGITKFCIHPERWFRSKTRIGGTKTLDLQKIAALRPDLIIANKEENEHAQVEALMQDYPVWVSDIKTLEDALAMIRSVGTLCGKAGKGREIADEIAAGFAALVKPLVLQKSAYAIWRNPWMWAGGDTFIHEMLSKGGFENVLADAARYPELSLEAMAARQPELLLLSSEPYPFKEKHIAELSAAMPSAQVLLADGELFSWYGSRLLRTPAYLSELKSII